MGKGDISVRFICLQEYALVQWLAWLNGNRSTKTLRGELCHADIIVLSVTVCQSTIRYGGQNSYLRMIGNQYQSTYITAYMRLLLTCIEAFTMSALQRWCTLIICRLGDYVFDICAYVPQPRKEDSDVITK